VLLNRDRFASGWPSGNKSTCQVGPTESSDVRHRIQCEWRVVNHRWPRLSATLPKLGDGSAGALHPQRSGRVPAPRFRGQRIGPSIGWPPDATGPPAARLGARIVTAGRIPIRPHPKPIRIQNSDGWAFLTTVSAPRFPIQRVTWMGFLDRGQSKVTALLCSTAVSSRPSSRPRRNHAISLGQHHFYSCNGPLLTVAPVLLPSGPPPQQRRRHEVDRCFSALQLP